ncbi:MAG: hypothetical protein ACO3YU_10880, partial [Candidatus Nanopelagicales bacterium]
PLMVDRSHGGPETWTYDGPMPTQPRKGPDRRVILAGAAILVIGLGAILAMLLFKRAEPPTRSQEFARLPASSETGGSRATDGTESDSGGHAAADASPNRQEKIPAPGKGMGFPTTPPAGGTARESGSPSTEQGTSAGGGDQSASPPPSKPEPDDSSQKTDADGTASGGATPPSWLGSEATGSQPPVTDSTSGVTPPGAGTPPPMGDATGSTEASAFQTGSSDAREQVDVECDCNDEEWILKIPTPTEWTPTSDRPIDGLLARVDAAVEIAKNSPALAHTLLSEAWEFAQINMQDTDVLIWVTETDIDNVIDSVKHRNADYQKKLQELQRRITDIARVTVTVEVWIEALAIGNAPELFGATGQPEKVAQFLRDMITYLCRLRAFITQWEEQSRAITTMFQWTKKDSRARWHDFIKRRLEWPQSPPTKFARVRSEIESYLDRIKEDKKQPSIGVADGVGEWVSYVSSSCDESINTCLMDIVELYFK